jgi:hypothetical protein
MKRRRSLYAQPEIIRGAMHHGALLAPTTAGGSGWSGGRHRQALKAKDVDKKLQELQRKTDEQIDKGKIRGPAVGQVRQAVAQFSQAVRSR